MLGFPIKGKKMQALRKMTKTKKNGGSVEGSGSKMQDRGRTLSVLTGRTERDLMGRRGCFAQDAVRRNVEGRGPGWRRGSAEWWKWGSWRGE